MIIRGLSEDYQKSSDNSGITELYMLRVREETYPGALKLKLQNKKAEIEISVLCFFLKLYT